MPNHTVYVAFNVRDVAELDAKLQSEFEHDDNVVGFRTGQTMEHRAALRQFADAMETTLRRHDDKKHWRELPIEALVRLLMIEVEEMKVALDFFTVKEARGESIDLANFALFIWDRLGLEKPDAQVTNLIKDKV